MEAGAQDDVLPVHEEDVHHEVAECLLDDLHRAAQQLGARKDGRRPAADVGKKLKAERALALDQPRQPALVLPCPAPFLDLALAFPRPFVARRAHRDDLAACVRPGTGTVKQRPRGATRRREVRAILPRGHSLPACGSALSATRPSGRFAFLENVISRGTHDEEEDHDTTGTEYDVGKDAEVVQHPDHRARRDLGAAGVPDPVRDRVVQLVEPSRREAEHAPCRAARR